jgi:hypothetical protein
VAEAADTLAVEDQTRTSIQMPVVVAEAISLLLLPAQPTLAII